MQHPGLASPPFGLLSSCRSENLGDEIQSLAAEPFLPRVDALVERDYLGQHRQLHTQLILNGWFLLGRDWPPPPSVEPLMVSFFPTPEHPRVLAAESVDWYKRHEPIGCRSLETVAAFEGLGVRAYFSGCLTLCTPKPDVSETGQTLIVDCDQQMLARFVPESVRRSAVYVTHVALTDGESLARRIARRAFIHGMDAVPEQTWARFRKWRSDRHRKRRSQAQALLRQYAGARLVITSRLHCYLPCLALGTPVLLLHRDPSDPRFLGLSGLGRCVTPSDDGVDIDWQNPAPNPGRHLALARELSATCQRWVAERRAPLAAAAADC